jgi:hypothetical protein
MSAPNLLEKRRPPGELSGTQQISIAPWTDWPLPREKREKNKLNNKQAAEQKNYKIKFKRHVEKREGHPELQRVGEGHSPLEL